LPSRSRPRRNSPAERGNGFILPSSRCRNVGNRKACRFVGNGPKGLNHSTDGACLGRCSRSDVPLRGSACSATFPSDDVASSARSFFLCCWSVDWPLRKVHPLRRLALRHRPVQVRPLSSRIPSRDVPTASAVTGPQVHTLPLPTTTTGPTRHAPPATSRLDLPMPRRRPSDPPSPSPTTSASPAMAPLPSPWRCPAARS